MDDVSSTEFAFIERILLLIVSLIFKLIKVQDIKTIQLYDPLFNHDASFYLFKILLIQNRETHLLDFFGLYFQKFGTMNFLYGFCTQLPDDADYFEFFFFCLN